MTATLAMDRVIRSLAPDDIWFLGDCVGKGPRNDETCDYVRSVCRHWIGGNWDYGIGFREFPADAFFWDQLGEERLAWLRGLPQEDEIQAEGLRIRLFHGRPVTPLLTVEMNASQLIPLFSTDRGVFDGVIFADSHRPFVRTLSCGYLANTGSVGNSMGVPRAHALILETFPLSRALSLQVLSVPYDNEAEAALARATPDLPHGDAYIREVLTGIYSRGLSES